MQPLQYSIASPEGRKLKLELPVSGTSQCVGFARRWLEINLGLTFAEVNKAVDIWHRVTTYKRLSDNTHLNAANRNNGHSHPPQYGDLVIYDRRLGGSGHVAVVTAVDCSMCTISLVEQNFNNRYQAPDKQRDIPFLKSRDGFTLLQQHIIGWKHIAIDEI